MSHEKLTIVRGSVGARLDPDSERGRDRAQGDALRAAASTSSGMSPELTPSPRVSVAESVICAGSAAASVRP